MIPGLDLVAGGGIGGPSAASSNTGAASVAGLTFAPPAKFGLLQLGVAVTVAVAVVLLLRK